MLVYAVSPCFKSAVKSQKLPSMNNRVSGWTDLLFAFFVRSHCVSRIFPIRRESFSVSSGVMGTPVTKQNPNRSWGRQKDAKLSTHPFFIGLDRATYDLVEPFVHSVIGRDDFFIMNSRWVLVNACTPKDFPSNGVNSISKDLNGWDATTYSCGSAMGCGCSFSDLFSMIGSYEFCRSQVHGYTDLCGVESRQTISRPDSFAITCDGRMDSGIWE